MGVPLSGPSFAYGDKISVIHNTQRPESVLKNKSNYICYHACREAVAVDEMLTGHVCSENYLAILATKVFGGGAKLNGLISHLLYDFIEYVWDGLRLDITLQGPRIWNRLPRFPLSDSSLTKYSTEYRNMSCIYERMNEVATYFLDEKSEGAVLTYLLYIVIWLTHMRAVMRSPNGLEGDTASHTNPIMTSSIVHYDI